MKSSWPANQRMAVRHCLDCPEDISARSPTAKRCAPCAAAAQKRQIREWMDRERPRMREIWVAFHARHRERLRQEARQRYHANPAKEKARFQRYYNTPSGQAAHRRASGNRRIKREQQRGCVSGNIVERRMAEQRGRCAFCGKKIKGTPHLDHIVPLSLGGLHDDSNLQMLCAFCNLSKGDKDPIEFAQQHGRLL